MAGDGEKTLTQTTTSACHLSQPCNQNEDLVSPFIITGPSSWEDVESFLDDNISNAESLPAVSTVSALETQIKTEPTDDYISSSCCGHSAMMYSANTNVEQSQLPFGTYPNQMITSRTAGAIQPASVKTEATVQPACPGSTRKPRKGKAIKDEDRKERRKAQNRQAAKIYREKQKTKKEKVESDYNSLIAENAEKENEIHNLRTELEKLQRLLKTHKSSGCCRMAVSMPSDTLPAEIPVVSRVPKPIDIPSFNIVSEVDKAPQVPPYTPSSEQSFGFEANIYSPQSDEKVAGREQVYSPLDGQDLGVAISPVPDEVFKSDLENLGHQDALLDMNQWQNVLDCLR